jgi:hypothetical protein
MALEHASEICKKKRLAVLDYCYIESADILLELSKEIRDEVEKLK